MVTNLTFFKLFSFLYIIPKGRIGRLSFILSNLFLLLISFIISSFVLVYFSNINLYELLLIYYVAFIYPNYCIIIKRCQDLSVSPKFTVILYLLTPVIYIYSNSQILIYTTVIVSLLAFLVLCLKRGSRGSNNFGKNPISESSLQDINFSLFQSLLISTFIGLSVFFMYKDIIVEKHLKPKVKYIVQNKAVMIQLNAVAQWSKTIKTDKYKNATEEQKNNARIGFANHIHKKIKKLNVYTDEELKKDYYKFIDLLKSVENHNKEKSTS